MSAVPWKYIGNSQFLARMSLTRLGAAFAVVLGLVASAPSMATSPGPFQSVPELSARWWQWAFSFPTAVNPLTDPSGARCTFGQNGDVWFLGGSLNSSDPVRRSCAPVPAGRYILIPALNAECSSVEGDGDTAAALRRCVDRLIKGARGSAKVDGKPLKVFRVNSPPFLFALPANDVLGRGPAVSKAVAAGLWALIPPLATGEHKIEVLGSVGTFTQNVTYQVTVAAP